MFIAFNYSAHFKGVSTQRRKGTKARIK